MPSPFSHCSANSTFYSCLPLSLLFASLQYPINPLKPKIISLDAKIEYPQLPSSEKMSRSFIHRYLISSSSPPHSGLLENTRSLLCISSRNLVDTSVTSNLQSGIYSHRIISSEYLLIISTCLCHHIQDGGEPPSANQNIINLVRFFVPKDYPCVQTVCLVLKYFPANHQIKPGTAFHETVSSVVSLTKVIVSYVTHFFIGNSSANLCIPIFNNDMKISSLNIM